MKSPDERLDAAIGAAGSTPSAAGLDGLARAAREELGRHPETRPWWIDGLLVLGINLVMGVGAAAMMSWSDVQHGSTATKYAVGLAWFAVMAVGSVWWLAPGPRTARWVVLGGFGLTVVLAMGNASGFDPGSPFFRGVSCAFFECGLALVPLAVVLLLSLRFAARPLHLFTASLASGAGGAMALHFHCPNGTLGHLVVFHLAPVVLMAALAVFIRGRLPSRSFVP